MVYHGLCWFIIILPIQIAEIRRGKGCTTVRHTLSAVPEGPASICAEHQVVAWQCLAGCTLR